MKKTLKRLDNKQVFEDINNYVKNNHEFYNNRIPEIRTLAKRLHEEQGLKEFYKIFNKLWNLGYHDQRVLAIHTLQLYNDEFNLATWRFIKPKLKDITSGDEADAIAIKIVGEIFLRCPSLERELIRLSKDKNAWLRRIAIVSTLPLIKKGNVRFTLRLSEEYLKYPEEQIQKAVGWMLKEINYVKPGLARNFIVKNMKVISNQSFNIAVEHRKDRRQLIRLKTGKKGLFDFWFG